MSMLPRPYFEHRSPSTIFDRELEQFLSLIVEMGRVNHNPIGRFLQCSTLWSCIEVCNSFHVFS